MASTDPLVDRVRGYPKLACQMELRPEVAIFRRFGALNAENLLYFQAELAMLERDLRDRQSEDSHYPDKAKYASSWYQLSNSKDRDEDSQLSLVYKIREKLRLYSESSSAELATLS